MGKALEPVLAWAKDTLLSGRASSLDPILQISRLNPVWFFPRTAASSGFSSLAFGSYHRKALYKPILHLIKFNYSIFFVLKRNNRPLKGYFSF